MTSGKVKSSSAAVIAFPATRSAAAVEQPGSSSQESVTSRIGRIVNFLEYRQKGPGQKSFKRVAGAESFPVEEVYEPNANLDLVSRALHDELDQQAYYGGGGADARARHAELVDRNFLWSSTKSAIRKAQAQLCAVSHDQALVANDLSMLINFALILQGSNFGGRDLQRLLSLAVTEIKKTRSGLKELLENSYQKTSRTAPIASIGYDMERDGVDIIYALN